MERKKLLGQTCTYFSVFFRNSFVTSFILTRMLSEPFNKNKYNVELRFYSVVTCVTLPIQHNVFQSSMDALTIRYRPIRNLNLGVLFHYCTNFAFLCVYVSRLNKKQKVLSGQNQDDKLHRWEEQITPGCFYIVQSINTQVFVGLYMDQS